MLQIVCGVKRLVDLAKRARKAGGYGMYAEVIVYVCSKNLKVVVKNVTDSNVKGSTTCTIESRSGCLGL